MESNNKTSILDVFLVIFGLFLFLSMLCPRNERQAPIEEAGSNSNPLINLLLTSTIVIAGAAMIYTAPIIAPTIAAPLMLIKVTGALFTGIAGIGLISNLVKLVANSRGESNTSHQKGTTVDPASPRSQNTSVQLKNDDIVSFRRLDMHSNVGDPKFSGDKQSSSPTTKFSF